MLGCTSQEWVLYSAWLKLAGSLFLCMFGMCSNPLHGNNVSNPLHVSNISNPLHGNNIGSGATPRCACLCRK